jgi:hypothetical protein
MLIVFFLLGPMGSFIPVGVSQIAIFCNLVCNLARVLYSACKKSVCLTYVPLFTLVAR